jgi:hexokinase
MRSQGPVIVIDAGGTNFRSALLSLDPEKGFLIEKFEKKPCQE